MLTVHDTLSCVKRPRGGRRRGWALDLSSYRRARTPPRRSEARRPCVALYALSTTREIHKALAAANQYRTGAESSSARCRTLQRPAAHRHRMWRSSKQVSWQPTSTPLTTPSRHLADSPTPDTAEAQDWCLGSPPSPHSPPLTTPDRLANTGYREAQDWRRGRQPLPHSPPHDHIWPTCRHRMQMQRKPKTGALAANRYPARHPTTTPGRLADIGRRMSRGWKRSRRTPATSTSTSTSHKFQRVLLCAKARRHRTRVKPRLEAISAHACYQHAEPSRQLMR